MEILSAHKYAQADENKVFARVRAKDIAFLTKIVEAYEHLALVTTLDPQEGLVVFHVTPDTREPLLEIIKNLPVQVHLL